MGYTRKPPRCLVGKWTLTKVMDILGRCGKTLLQRIRGQNATLWSKKTPVLSPVPTSVTPPVSTSAYEIHPRTSPGARAILELVTWKDCQNADSNAVGAKYMELVDVIVIDKAMFDDIGEVADHWNKAGLLSLGFLTVSRPSVVVERGTYHILSLFLTGVEVSSLTDLALKLPDLHKGFHPNMNPIRSRKDLVMIGFRDNEKQNNTPVLKKNMSTGYYCAKSDQKAADLWRNEALIALAAHIATSMCQIERDVSPAMGAHRSAHAVLSRFPGFMPGMSTDVCSAAALGVSEGYVSEAHNDAGALGMAEFIIWLSSMMCQSSEYVFADVGARIVFDLVNISGSALCIIPGTERHGTPGLSPTYKGKGKGLGAVIVNKANLVTKRAIGNTQLLLRRMKGDISPNPFRGSIAIKNQRMCDLKCGKKGTLASLRVCDECNKAMHRRCGSLTLHCSLKGVNMWFCRCCSRLVKNSEKNGRKG